MPVIVAYVLKGRSPDIKRRLAAALTASVADILDVQPQSVHVLIDELDRENWATGGELNSDRQSVQRTDELDLDTLFKKPAPATAPPRRTAKVQPRKAPAKSRSRR
jgi:4-oxalocrotonate tautomerase